MSASGRRPRQADLLPRVSGRSCSRRSSSCSGSRSSAGEGAAREARTSSRRRTARSSTSSSRRSSPAGACASWRSRSCSRSVPRLALHRARRRSRSSASAADRAALRVGRATPCEGGEPLAVFPEGTRNARARASERCSTAPPTSRRSSACRSCRSASAAPSRSCASGTGHPAAAQGRDRRRRSDRAHRTAATGVDSAGPRRRRTSPTDGQAAGRAAGVLRRGAVARRSRARAAGCGRARLSERGRPGLADASTRAVVGERAAARPGRRGVAAEQRARRASRAPGSARAAPAGGGKYSSSSVTCTGSTPSRGSSFAITAWTRSSGALAPAVTPTTRGVAQRPRARARRDRRRAAPARTRRSGPPSSSAIVFDEFALPITTTASASAAIAVERGLAVRRGEAEVVAGRRPQLGELLAGALHDALPVVEGERRLREQRDLVGVVDRRRATSSRSALVLDEPDRRRARPRACRRPRRGRRGRRRGPCSPCRPGPSPRGAPW